FQVPVAFRIDPLSMTMMLVVTGVGFLIHLYSVGYMAEDALFARYFTYLNLFTFAMLILVMANNYVLMFVGWDGVGLCSFLLIGATGKSAQLPLYLWLPDAMEGPTPVSALIHAATMVTAGVYMVARSHDLFAAAPMALNVVAWVGVITALFAATVAVVQYDI